MLSTNGAKRDLHLTRTFRLTAPGGLAARGELMWHPPGHYVGPKGLHHPQASPAVSSSNVERRPSASSTSSSPAGDHAAIPCPGCHAAWCNLGRFNLSEMKSSCNPSENPCVCHKGRVLAMSNGGHRVRRERSWKGVAVRLLLYISLLSLMRCSDAGAEDPEPPYPGRGREPMSSRGETVRAPLLGRPRATRTHNPRN